MGGLKDGSVFGDTWKIMPNQLHGYVAEQIEVSNNNNPPARVGHSGVLCGNAFIIYGGDTVDTDMNGFPDNNFTCLTLTTTNTPFQAIFSTSQMVVMDILLA